MTDVAITQHKHVLTGILIFSVTAQIGLNILHSTNDICHYKFGRILILITTCGNMFDY